MISLGIVTVGLIKIFLYFIYISFLNCCILTLISVYNFANSKATLYLTPSIYFSS